MAKQNQESEDQNLVTRLEYVDQLLEEIAAETLGQRVVRAREQQGVSIRELADQAGLSKTSIVRLEQGRGTTALTLLKVCTALGIHVERMVGKSATDNAAIVHKNKDDRWFDAANMASTPLLGARRPLTEKERSDAVKDGAVAPINLLKARLTGGKILSSVIELHGPTPVRSHVGEEFVYVLEGSVTITISGKKHQLKQGEAITFWSAEPHFYQPNSKSSAPAKILSIRVDG